jgi:hypothetical protein
MELKSFTRSESHIEAIVTLRDFLTFENQKLRYDYIYNKLIDNNKIINNFFNINIVIPELKDIIKMAILSVIYSKELFPGKRISELTDERIDKLILYFNNIPDITLFNFQKQMSIIFEEHKDDYFRDFPYDIDLKNWINEYHLFKYKRELYISIPSHIGKVYKPYKDKISDVLFKMLLFDEKYQFKGLDNFFKIVKDDEDIKREIKNGNNFELKKLCDEYSEIFLNEEIKFFNENWGIVYFKNKINFQYIIIGNKATNFSVNTLIDGLFSDNRIRKSYIGFNLWNTRITPHGNVIKNKFDFFRHDIGHFRTIFNILRDREVLSLFFDKLYLYTAKYKYNLLYNFTTFIIWCYVFEGMKISTFKDKLNRNFDRNDIEDIDIEWNYKCIIKNSVDLNYIEDENYEKCQLKEDSKEKNVCIFNILFEDYRIKFYQNLELLNREISREELLEFEEFMGFL